MTPDEREHIRLAAHELGHALVGRDLGRPARVVVTMADRAFTIYEPRTEPETDATLADDSVIHMAGEIAGRYVDLSRIHVPPSVDDESTAIVAGIARVPDSDHELVAYTMRNAWPPGTTTDAEKIAAGALRIPEPARDAFLADCSTRAVLLVFEFLGLIEALIPLALRNPILTADDLNAGIAALMGQKGA